MIITFIIFNLGFCIFWCRTTNSPAITIRWPQKSGWKERVFYPFS